MIGGDQRRQAFVQRQAFELESRIEIDVVQMKQRQRARIGAPAPQVMANVCALKVRGQQVARRVRASTR